jgi:hypothetical protein
MRRLGILLPFSALLFACGSSPSPANDGASGATSAAITGSGTAANGASNQLAKYHWAPWNAGTGAAPAGAYLAGVMDTSRAAPVAHSPMWICRAPGGGGPGVATGSGVSCLILSPKGGLISSLRSYEVLVADDPDAFTWVPYAGSVPANAITTQGYPFCRVWEEGTDVPATSRGIDVGTVVNNACATPNGLSTSGFEILTERAPAASCNDAVETWPADAAWDQQRCDGESVYTPTCYKSAPSASCGISGYPQIPLYGTCADRSFGLQGWSPQTSMVTTIADNCQLNPCEGLYQIGECNAWADQYECGLVGTNWCNGKPQTSAVLQSVNADMHSLTCKINYSTPIWNTGTGPACGIVGYRNDTAHPIYNTCRAIANGVDTASACGATPVHAPRGLTTAMAEHLAPATGLIICPGCGPGAAGTYPAIQCTTCENLGIDSSSPAAYQASVAAKFSCLYQSYGAMSVQGDEEGAESAGAIVRDMKLLFELHGDALTDPTQRAFVQSLYAPPVTSASNELARCTAENLLSFPAGPNAPMLVARAPHTLDLLYEAPSTNVRFHELSGMAWGPEVDLGGGTLSRPGVAAWGFSTGENRLDVFSPGTDHQLWHNWYTPSLGGHWEPLGGSMAGGAGVSSWGSGRLDIFYIGPDHALKHRFYDESWHASFSDEESLGGNYVGDVSAVSWGTNRIDIVMRGADGTLQHEWWNNGWGGPEVLATGVTSSPTVASWGVNRLDIFWLTASVRMHHRAFDQGWLPEEDLGILSDDSPSAVSSEPNRVDVATKDIGTGRIVLRSFMNGASGALSPADCTWLDTGADLLCGGAQAPTVSLTAACREATGSQHTKYEQDITELATCQALTLPHVPAAVVESEVDRCEAAIMRLQNYSANGCSQGASADLGYKLVQTALSMPLATGDGLQADLQRRLGHIDAYWRTIPYAKKNTAQVATQADQLVGLVYKPLYALKTTDNQGAPRTASLQELAGTATSLLDAAFTPYAAGPTPTQGPLTTAPLGVVISSALQPLVDRLETLGVFQDLACRYTPNGCIGASTQLTQLWNEIATLASASNYHAAVGNAALVTDPWKTAFGNVDTLHATLDKALSDAGIYTAWNPSGTTTAPATLEQLAKIIVAARTRVASFAALGQLELGSPDTLHTGLQDAKVTAIVGQLNSALTVLDSDTQTYGSASNTLIQNLITDLHNKNELTSLVDKLNGLQQQFDDDTTKLQALRMSEANQASQFGDFMKAFQAAVANPAFDPNAKIQAAPSVDVEVRPSDAHWSPSFVGNVDAAAVQGWKIPSANVPPGSTINLQVTGAWSPTCALSKSKMPDGSTPNSTGVQIGPEGFALSYSNGAYSAASQQSSVSDSDSNGYSENNCQSFNWNLGLGWQYVVNIGAGGSGSDQTCDFSSSTHTSTTASLSSKTDEQRTTATFAAGMRLADTPFPDAPAGALLLVEVKAGTHGAAGEVHDVRVLRSPNTSVLVAGNYDYYLVVNDDASCGGGGTAALHVTSTVLQTVGAKAKEMGTAMATAYNRVRGQVDQLAQQGSVQPDQGALLRAQAYNDVRAACTAAEGQGVSCEPTAYPPALLGVFDTWLDSEIVRMERQVDIMNLERARHLVVLDMKGTTDDLAANGAEAALTSQLTDWEMFNLDAAILRSDTSTLANLAAQYLYPIAKLRYPSVLSGLATDPAAQPPLQALSAVTWDSQVQTLAGNAVLLGKELASVFQTALNNGQNASSRVQWAVLSIPNPNAQLPTIGGAANPDAWQTIDTARAQEIWSALRSGSSVTITVNPDDLYNVHAGSSILTCAQSVPVIDAMGVYVGTIDSSFDALNVQGYGLPMSVSDRLQFPTATGAQSFRFDNSAWLNQPVRTHFGIGPLAMNAVQQDLANAQAQAGLSPFGQFKLDFTSLQKMSPSPLDDSEATEIDLVFQLDVAPVGSSLTYLPACRTP